MTCCSAFVSLYTRIDNEPVDIFPLLLLSLYLHITTIVLVARITHSLCAPWGKRLWIKDYYIIHNLYSTLRRHYWLANNNRQTCRCLSEKFSVSMLLLLLEIYSTAVGHRWCSHSHSCLSFPLSVLFKSILLDARPCNEPSCRWSDAEWGELLLYAVYHSAQHIPRVGSMFVYSRSDFYNLQQAPSAQARPSTMPAQYIKWIVDDR